MQIRQRRIRFRALKQSEWCAIFAVLSLLVELLTETMSGSLEIQLEQHVFAFKLVFPFNAGT